jgi:hypothetical protein
MQRAEQRIDDQAGLVEARVVPLQPGELTPPRPGPRGCGDEHGCSRSSRGEASGAVGDGASNDQSPPASVQVSPSSILG